MKTEYTVDISSLKVKKICGLDFESGVSVKIGDGFKTIPLPKNMLTMRENDKDIYYRVVDSKDGLKRPYTLKNGAFYICTDKHLYEINDDNKLVIAEHEDVKLTWVVGEARKYDPKASKK